MIRGTRTRLCPENLVMVAMNGHMWCVPLVGGAWHGGQVQGWAGLGRNRAGAGQAKARQNGASAGQARKK